MSDFFFTQKFSIFLNRSQETSENPTVNLSAFCNSCAKISCCSSELFLTFLFAGSNSQNASEQFVSCTAFSFVNWALHSTKLKSKGVRFGDSSRCILVTIGN